MTTPSADAIRNVAVVGHNRAGKAQLVSAPLYTAGAPTRLGKVADGTAPTDYDDEAIARKHTLAATPAWATWRDHKINLIDTPGFGSFLSETGAAMRVADAALVVVDAVSGVEAQTERVWAMAADEGLPRLIVVNRMDRERADLGRVVAHLREVFGRSVVPVTLPIGAEREFRGVVDLLTQQAYSYADDSGKSTAAAVPAGMEAEAREARERLVEMVAEADDKLMERFFEEGTLTDDELIAGLRQAVRAGLVVPVFCTSAIASVGSDVLLSALVDLALSPAERPFRALEGADGQPVEVSASDAAPARLFVWKTVADPFAGRISLFRVVTGTVSDDTSLAIVGKAATERLGHILTVQGKTQQAVPVLHAGDLGAVAKLKETQTGDTLAEKGSDLRLPPITFAEPLMSYALEPKSRA